MFQHDDMVNPKLKPKPENQKNHYLEVQKSDEVKIN